MKPLVGLAVAIATALAACAQTPQTPHKDASVRTNSGSDAPAFSAPRRVEDPIPESAESKQDRINETYRQIMAQSYSQYPPDVAPLIKEVDATNELCRDGTGDEADTANNCEKRDYVITIVNAKGWCWGPDAAADADKHWMPCSPAARPNEGDPIN